MLRLLERIRSETALSAILFTGYRWAELVRMPELAVLRAHVNVMIAGRYEQDRRLGRGLRGSANKTVHLFSDRCTTSDLDAVADGEVIIRPNGEVVVTGSDPPLLTPDPDATTPTLGQAR